MHEPVSEEELHAYVDGHLDPRRLPAVERWLAAHPDKAARIMADRALAGLLRNGLNQAVAGPHAGGVETHRRARRLGRRLLLRRVTHGMGRAAAAILLVGAGWGLHVGMLAYSSPAGAAAGMPLFVDEAADAYRTAMRDHTLEHGLSYSDLAEPAELAALEPDRRVEIPAPRQAAWALLGAQMVPWDEGDAAQVFWRGDGDSTLVLFAAGAGPEAGEVPTLGDNQPQVAVLNDHTYVYWRAGAQVYVLSGNVAADELMAIAADLHGQTG